MSGRSVLLHTEYETCDTLSTKQKPATQIQESDCITLSLSHVVVTISSHMYSTVPIHNNSFVFFPSSFQNLIKFCGFRLFRIKCIQAAKSSDIGNMDYIYRNDPHFYRQMHLQAKKAKAISSKAMSNLNLQTK